MDRPEKTPPGTAIRPSRTSLLATGAILALFYVTDAAAPRPALAMAARTAWIVTFVGCALLSDAQRAAWAAAVDLALGSASAAAMVLLAWATGGSAGTFFGFVYAVPFVIAMFLPQSPPSAAAASVITLAGGLAVLAAEHRTPGELLRFGFIVLGASVAAVHTAVTHRRMALSEIAAERARSDAAARLRASEIDRLDAEQRMRAALAEAEVERAENKLRAVLEERVKERTRELRLKSEELERAKEAAEAASRAKSAFLANMSHEIRTPMNAVLGYTQLLQRDPALSPAQRGHLDVVSRSGEHLLGLINDVLEMSKIEAGYHELDASSADLCALLDDLAAMFRVRTDDKRLRFGVERAPDLPRFVVVDEGKLRRVLVNLVGNAVKFTEAGSVVVRARSTDPGAARLVVEVEDTGPGIAAEKLPTLFRPFAQVEVGIAAHGGTGLGLALSREFARLMGGDITVESRVGEGSVFRLEVPVVLDLVPAARPAPRGRVLDVLGDERRLRALVVDADADSRGFLAQLLAEVGFEVREARDGAEALAAFDTRPPAVVLMGVSLPVMDGYAATRALRARPAGPGAVIIAVTAGASDERRGAILEAGADAVLSRPCREDDLLEEIRRHLGLAYRYDGASAAGRSSAPPDPTAFGEALATSLSPALLAELRAAAHIADYDRLNDLLGQVPAEHAGVGEALRALVERYRYDDIEAALSVALSEAGRLDRARPGD